MTKIPADRFLSELNEADTQFRVSQVLEKVYSFEASSTGQAFKSNVENSWDVFYKMKEKEDELHMEHGASAYYVMDLISPKLHKLWLSKETMGIKKWSEYGDFLTAVWCQINSKLNLKENKKGKIEGWDKDKNDNFLAYIIPEIRTVLNEVTETEISKHLANSREISLTSLDALMDNEDSPLQVGDDSNMEKESIDNMSMREKITCLKTFNPEDSIIDRLDNESEMKKARKSKKSNNKETQSLIRNSLTVAKLFGGDLPDIIEDDLSPVMV